jgi:hypothetical protein
MIGEKKKKLLQVGHAKTACQRWVSSDVIVSKPGKYRAQARKN